MVSFKCYPIEKQVVIWNNMFPCDKWWRDKYNIPIFSTAHRETSQMSILFEYLEHQKVLEQIEKNKQSEEKQKALKRGEIFSVDGDSNKVNTKAEMEMFDDLDLSSLNNIPGIEVEDNG